ncbi:MAG: transporter substrate-binding domain-containing protein [Spirochaetaceae bacterium]
MPTTISRKASLLVLLVSVTLAFPVVFGGSAAAEDLPGIRRRGRLEVAARPISTLIYSPGNSDLPGFCYELAREFARSLNVEIAVEPVDSFSAYWESGKDQESLSLFDEVDLYAEILTVTPRREELLHMCPYVENTEILVGGADSRATKLRDLLGKRVAVVEGMAFQEVLENALSQQGVSFTRVPVTIEGGVIVSRQPRDAEHVQLLLLPPGERTTLLFFPEQLARGSIDFFILDSFSLFHQLNISQAFRNLVRPLFPVNENVGELAFGSSFDTPELNRALSQWMREFRTTADYDSLVKRYIGMSYDRYRGFIEDFPE